MIFFIFLLILSIIGSFKFKSDKTVTGIIAILLLIIFAAEYGDADYQSYWIEYQNMTIPNWNDTEPLWMWIQYFFRSLNMPFVIFRGIIFACGLCFIQKTLNIITADRNVILLLFFMYPFMMDCTQIRNYFAMSILILGLGFLIRKNRVDTFKFCCSVFVCTLIHNVFAIYIVLVVLPWVDYRKCIGLISFISVIALILIDKLPVYVMMLFGNYHGGLYAYKYVRGVRVSFSMTIALLVFYMLNLFLLLKSVSIYKNAKIEGAINESYENTVVESAKVCIAVIPFFVLNLYSMDFSRIYRNVILITYAVCWESSRYCKYTVILRAALVAMSIIGAYVFIYYPYSSTVFWPILANNSVFEFLSFS